MAFSFLKRVLVLNSKKGTSIVNLLANYNYLAYNSSTNTKGWIFSGCATGDTVGKRIIHNAPDTVFKSSSTYFLPVVAGERYKFSAKFTNNAGGGSMFVGIKQINNVGTIINDMSVFAPTCEITITVQAGVVKLQPYMGTKDKAGQFIFEELALYKL